MTIPTLYHWWVPSTRFPRHLHALTDTAAGAAVPGAAVLARAGARCGITTCWFLPTRSLRDTLPRCGACCHATGTLPGFGDPNDPPEPFPPFRWLG